MNRSGFGAGPIGSIRRLQPVSSVRVGLVLGTSPIAVRRRWLLNQRPTPRWQVQLAEAVPGPAGFDRLRFVEADLGLHERLVQGVTRWTEGQEAGSHIDTSAVLTCINPLGRRQTAVPTRSIAVRSLNSSAWPRTDRGFLPATGLLSSRSARRKIRRGQLQQRPATGAAAQGPDKRRLLRSGAMQRGIADWQPR